MSDFPPWLIYLAVVLVFIAFLMVTYVALWKGRR